MLQKKMNARPSNAAVSSRKYYLDDKPSGRRMIRDGRHDEEDDEKGSDRIKWDKTDTDCKNIYAFKFQPHYAHGQITMHMETLCDELCQ